MRSHSGLKCGNITVTLSGDFYRSSVDIAWVWLFVFIFKHIPEGNGDDDWIQPTQVGSGVH